jgi:CHAD domain-containing protein
VAYRFELREQVASAFARIAVEQIDRVVRDLSAAREDHSLAVHESRKSLKRIRALLRLVRSGIGEATFKAENARFREIAALFSDDRDRHVLRSVAAGCAKDMGAAHRKAFAAISSLLAKPPVDAATASGVEKEALARLRVARREIAACRVQPDAFETISAGLKRSYRKGRRQLRRAYAAPDDEAFHDLRKAIQQHWRHMQVLQRAWPELFAARLSAARQLSQVLGDDHDLAVFVAYLGGLPRGVLAAADRRVIERHCRQRQRALRIRAYPLCQQLYAEGAGRFARRVTKIWRAAEDLAELEALEAQQRVPARKRPTKKKPVARA